MNSLVLMDSGQFGDVLSCVVLKTCSCLVYCDCVKKVVLFVRCYEVESGSPAVQDTFVNINLCAFMHRVIREDTESETKAFLRAAIVQKCLIVTDYSRNEYIIKLPTFECE
jgi:hypothetical protein